MLANLLRQMLGYVVDALQNERGGLYVDGVRQDVLVPGGPGGGDALYVNVTGDTMTGVLAVIAGTAAAPGLKVGAQESGLFAGTGFLGFAVDGAESGRFVAGGLQVAAVGPDADSLHALPNVAADTIVLLAATQTLAAKTLTTPTIGSFVNAGHSHADAAGGGTLDHGLALTGLTDDDHTQYVLRSVLTTDGDIFIRSGGVIARLAVGSAAQTLGVVTALPAWRSLLNSIAKAGSTALVGDVTLTGGTNITLTQTGQDISIAAAAAATSFPLLAPDGTDAAPSYSFASTTNTGMNMNAADGGLLLVAVGGQVAKFGGTGTAGKANRLFGQGLTLEASIPQIWFIDTGADTDLKQHRWLYDVNGGIPMTMRLENDADTDSSPYFQVSRGTGVTAMTVTKIEWLTGKNGTTGFLRYEIDDAGTHRWLDAAAVERMRQSATGGLSISMGGTLVPTSPVAILDVFTETAANRAIRQTYAAGDANPSLFQMRKSRGTIATPVLVNSGDVLGSIEMYGYGTSFVAGAQIRAFTTEAWSASVAGTTFDIVLVRDGSLAAERRYMIAGAGQHSWFNANNRERMILAAEGGVQITAADSPTEQAAVAPATLLELRTMAPSRRFASIDYALADALGGSFFIRKARGTLTTPAAVASADVLGTFEVRAFADAYQTAFSLSVTAAETWSATVSGATLALSLSRAAADNSLTQRYGITGAGVHTWYSDAAATLMTLINAGSLLVGLTAETETFAGINQVEVRGSTGQGLFAISTAAADGEVTIGQVMWKDRNATGEKSPARIAVALVGATANNRGGEMTISTKANNGALIDAIYINNLQQVGFGAAVVTPVSTLEVAETGTGFPRGIMSTQHSTGTHGAQITGRKSRGSRGTPLLLQAADRLMDIGSQGYDGVAYGDGPFIRFQTTEIWSGTAHGADMRFLVNANAGTGSAERMILGQSGGVMIANGGTLAATAPVNLLDLITETAAGRAAQLTYAAADANGGAVILRKSRGSIAVPGAAVAGDVLGDFTVQGYADQFQDAMFIRVEAAETWSATVSGANAALYLSRTGIDNSATKRYDVTGAGVHTWYDTVAAAMMSLSSGALTTGQTALSLQVDRADVEAFVKVTLGATGSGGTGLRALVVPD